ARGASVLDYSTGLPAAEVGKTPRNSTDLAAGTVALLHTGLDAAALCAAPGGDDLEDVVVTSSCEYHIFVCLPTRFDSRLALHVWLERPLANLAFTGRALRALIDGLPDD